MKKFGFGSYSDWLKAMDINVSAKIWTQMCLESSDAYKPHMVNV